MTQEQQLLLQAVELSEVQAIAAVRKAAGNHAEGFTALFHSLGVDATWTAVILSQLRPRGRQLRRGRIQWLLSTALPLNPGFTLNVNGAEVSPSKLSHSTVWKFDVGPGDLTLETDYAREATSTGVWLPSAGTIRGSAQLFKDGLERGKSEDLGRSHGFFVRVLGRLINIDDETFGIKTELSHGVLTRFRMVLDADGLDPDITSGREAVKEGIALTRVREYLLATFNLARTKWAEYELGDDARRISIAARIARAPAVLSEEPLRRILTQAGSQQDVPDLRIAAMLSSDIDPKAINAALAEQSLLSDVQLKGFGPEEGVARYDPQSAAVIVNEDHPFIDNYRSNSGAIEVLRLIATAEFLTAVYMLDVGISPGVVDNVINRRDQFLRALVQLFPRSAPAVAQLVRDAGSGEKQLEDAIAIALDHLGFYVKPRSGKGKTDVVARAVLGLRSGDEGAATMTYSFVADAKSTSHDVIQAAKVNPGQLHRHRRKEKADFVLVVAPDFAGGAALDSAISDYCTKHKVTALRTGDLARIVELHATRVVTPQLLRGVFDVFTPDETHVFVSELEASAPERPRPPVRVLLEAIRLLSNGLAPVSISGLPNVLNSTYRIDLSLSTVRSMIHGLSLLAPVGLYREGNFVALQTSVDQVVNEIRANAAALPDFLHGHLDEAFD